MLDSGKKQGAVRKRQQIKESSKTMFLWVAGMSVVVGFALVVSWFLWQQLVFRTEIVSHKNQTLATLVHNNETAPELRDNIRVLETNTALNSSKANPSDKALQVILDALPSEANSLALGASLQQVLTDGVSGLSVESLSVTPVAADSATSDSAASPDESSDNRISFRLVVESANINAHRELLERFERSVRVIDIDSLRLESGQNTYTMTLEAHAYYQPPKMIELTDKQVKP